MSLRLRMVMLSLKARRSSVNEILLFEAGSGGEWFGDI